MCNKRTRSTHPETHATERAATSPAAVRVVLPDGAAEEALAAVARMGAVMLTRGPVTADGTRQARGRGPCHDARCLAAAHAHTAHDGHAHVPNGA